MPPRAVCECLETYSAGLCGAIAIMCPSSREGAQIPTYNRAKRPEVIQRENSDGLRFVMRPTSPKSESKVSSLSAQCSFSGAKFCIARRRDEEK